MLGGALMAAAQEDMPPQPIGARGGQGRPNFQMPEFADLDKNKDKKISKDEFPQNFPSQFFDRLDENKDGFIDEQEWSRSRQRFAGGGRGMGDRFTQFMDANKDGKVSDSEFAKISEVFDALDKDTSGDLSQDELNQFFQALGGGQGRGTRPDGPGGGGNRTRGDRPGGDRQGGDQGRRNFQMPNFADLDKNSDKKLSRDEMPEMLSTQFFDRNDQNKDGFIDEQEWTQSRQRAGGNTGERFIQFMDANKDAKVSREEFARVNETFGAMDKDKSGDLSSEELNQFFQSMAEVQARATGGVAVNNLFTKFDKDKDGKITAEEMGNERTFKALDLNSDGLVDREEADRALRQLAEKSKKQP